MTQRNDELMSKSRKTMLPHFNQARICTIKSHKTPLGILFLFGRGEGCEQWKLPLPIKSIVKGNFE